MQKISRPGTTDPLSEGKTRTENTASASGTGRKGIAAAVRSARMFILDMSDQCSDDTYRYVVRRENELQLAAIMADAEAVIAAAEAAI